MNETMQIKRFTIDDVKPTKDLKKLNKDQLIFHIERLEKHAIQLDQALTLVLENIQQIQLKIANDTTTN